MPADRSPIELRRAEPRDVVQVLDIDAVSYPTPWSRQLVVREITSDQRIHLVAQRRFDILGHGAIVLLAGTAHVTTLAVRPDSRRKGIGRDLLLGLLRGAIVSGCTELTLEVRAGNAAAMALYRRFGLRPAGIRRGYYADTGDDALVLWAPDFDEAYRSRLDELEYADAVELSPELRSWEPGRPRGEELAQ